MLLIVTFFVTLAHTQAEEPRAVNPDTQVDPTPRIAIISAFAPELEKLRGAAQITSERVINGHRHYIGRLAEHDVVLLLSGVSMVNASMTTQSLLDHFTVRSIVFSGIAGGANPNLHMGDVTVPADWGQYQEQIFARETDKGWDPGWFSKGTFPNYGMMFPHPVSVPIPNGEPDKQEKRFWFPVDPEGLKVVQRIAKTVHLAKSTPDGGTLSEQPIVVVGGHGVSGPTFVNNANYREWVWNTFHADALDMETAAVATVAYVNQVPFIAFRSLSDLAGGGNGSNEAHVFMKLAAENSATVVLAYLNALNEKPVEKNEAGQVK